MLFCVITERRYERENLLVEADNIDDVFVKLTTGVYRPIDNLTTIEQIYPIHRVVDVDKY